MAERGTYTEGTKVRMLRDEYSFKKGAIGYIKFPYNDGLPSVWNADKTNWHYINENYFEVVDDEPPASYNVGDMIRLTSTGYCYTTYATKAHDLGANRYVNGKNPNTEHTFIVENYGRHSPGSETVVYLLRDTSTGQHYLAGNRYFVRVTDHPVGDTVEPSYNGVQTTTTAESGLLTFAGMQQAVELLQNSKEKPMEQTFKVGNRVRVKHYDKRPDFWNPRGQMDKYMGTVQTIATVYGNNVTLVGCDWGEEDTTWVFMKNDITLVTNEENEHMTDNTILNNPLKALREQPDADTIILRKAELENSDGTPTDQGKKALLEDLWQERRNTYAAKLRVAIQADAAAEAGETDSTKA